MPVMKALNRADLAAKRNTLEACDQWCLALALDLYRMKARRCSGLKLSLSC